MIIDLLLAVLAISALAMGYRQGGASAALSLIGVLLGGWAGIELMPIVLEWAQRGRELTPGLRVLLALGTITGAVVLGYAIGSGAGSSIRNSISTRSALRTDSWFGAAFRVVTTMVLVWMILVPAATNQGALGTALRESRGLAALNQVIPGWVGDLPMRVSAMANSNGFPVIMDPLQNVTPSEVSSPDPALRDSAVVAQARPAIAKVVGTATSCQRMMSGTGFVVATDTIMTNAHVVAGTDSIALDFGAAGLAAGGNLSRNGIVEAEVTYYDPSTDVALLHVPNLGIEPMMWADAVADHQQSAIVLGYPGGGDFTATPARVRDSFVVSGPDIYADKRVEREAYSLRATVVQGNSGGPLVDEQGRVLGLIFGADQQDTETGYALTKAEVMKGLGQDVAQWPTRYATPVDTGSCVL